MNKKAQRLVLIKNGEPVSAQKRKQNSCVVTEKRGQLKQPNKRTGNSREAQPNRKEKKSE